MNNKFIKLILISLVLSSGLATAGDFCEEFSRGYNSIKRGGHALPGCKLETKVVKTLKRNKNRPNAKTKNS